jgi:hypothetical protein
MALLWEAAADVSSNFRGDGPGVLTWTAKTSLIVSRNHGGVSGLLKEVM